MIAILLMVVGAILAVIGFLGLLALMIEPLYTMYMVIFKRKDDYVYYETKPGKALLQKNKSSLRNSCIFLLIVGILCFAAGWFLKFAPRGTDSLFSKQVEEGTGIGDAEAEKAMSGSINEAGRYVDGDGNEHANYLIIKGTRIAYRKDFEGSLEEFEKYLQGMDSKQSIYVVDEFAASSTYHGVEELLKYYGMTYELE